MKAVIVPEPGKVQIIEKSMPDIRGGNEVLVRVRLAGICGSDVHIYHGTSPVATYPRIIGHEVTGEIVAAGPDVTRVKVGDKVVLEPIRSCGNCYACRQGRKNVCANLQVYGVHLDGGYQPYLVLPEENVHKVGDYLSWEEAVLVEPFTIGAQANWRGDVKENDVVFIMGAGTIGLCALQIAKLKGAVCIVSDIFDSKLEYAKKMGADHTLNASRQDIRREIMELTGGLGPNVTIDAVCTANTFAEAVEITSVAGRVVVLGFLDAPSPIAQVEITKKELTVVGSRLQTNQFPAVIRWMNEGKLKVSDFITHRFPPEQFQEAVRLMETQPEQVRKVVLQFNS